MMTRWKSDHNDSNPALSAIVLVPNTYDSVRLIMGLLQCQTVASRIEVVLVVPSEKQLNVDQAQLAHFHSWQVVEVEHAMTMAEGYAVGIRRSRAPIVALTQDHAFPDTKWADLFITDHKQHWAAVGPRMCNGNPNTMISWADFYISYGEWAHRERPGKARHVPGHNSSYKRHVLIEFDRELEDLLKAESVLHRRLTEAGHELMIETGTCTSHLNHALWSSWFAKRFYQGQQFASTWSKQWPLIRRLCFVVVAPAIPCLRLLRLQKQIRQGQSLGFFMRLLPLLVTGLVAEGIGHVFGYVLGEGNCIEQVEKYESGRTKHAKQIENKILKHTRLHAMN